MSDARESMLLKIRAALRDVPSSERPDDVIVDRAYLTDDDASAAERLQLFVERVREYKATVQTVTPGNLPRAIADACRAQGVKRLAVPADLPAEWEPAGVTLVREPGLTNHDVENCDGVLTACVGQKRGLFTYVGVQALFEVNRARLKFTNDDLKAGVSPIPVNYNTGTYTVTKDNVQCFLL